MLKVTIEKIEKENLVLLDTKNPIPGVYEDDNYYVLIPDKPLTYIGKEDINLCIMVPKPHSYYAKTGSYIGQLNYMYGNFKKINVAISFS